VTNINRLDECETNDGTLPFSPEHVARWHAEEALEEAQRRAREAIEEA
jgi:hypothetical protein